ncbi:aspartyl protease family protein At5g10770-like [Zingiber officinale]|uniref:Peptidase A1 domain-containing protein n=1 Tax=Zingiber officinale TaxID=94328 RepID=A0A8J5HI74_ZINOF|nr:aspartyl protease family protein At5g10770-like [Zingiber officinale]KAG6525161.1 hypothetical protein ZIOFF_015113 [Zingiber officinale]
MSVLMVGIRAATSWFAFLPLVLVVAAGGGVSFLGEKKVLVLRPRFQLEVTKTSEKCLPQRSRRVAGATILEVKQQGRKDATWKVLAGDNARVRSLQSRLGLGNTVANRAEAASLEARLPLNSGAKVQTQNYIVTIELAGKQMTVIVDTGSDLTWVQCVPCKSCYSQEDPLFDPAASPSYQPIPCNTSTCDSLRAATGISGVCGSDRPSCNYELSYGDGSYTNGVLARDSISLASVSVEGFVFGCGRSNGGMFGGTSGLMGLGRAQLSLISQTTPRFGGVFSYCLPTQEFDSSGSLILGSAYDTFKNLTPVVFTNMLPDSSSYFLNLTGMSIGGVALQDQFSTKVLIDSGTVITRLAPSVYKLVKDEFSRQFSGFPPAPDFSILDTCFDLAGYKEVSIPNIRFAFQGDAEVEVDVSGVLYLVKQDASQACLAFASLAYEDEVGIIGNYQQKNLRVVYDTVGSRLGFAEENCGYS